MIATRGAKALILVLAMPLALAASSARANGPYELEYTVVKRFSTLANKTAASALQWDINSPDGIAWDGSGLWITACDAMSFIKLDVDGKLVDRFMLPTMEMVDHLAWDGTHLWGNVHSMPGDPGPPDGRLIRIDMTTHAIVDTVDVPFRDANSMTPMGTGFDGKYLWTNDPQHKRIYRIDPATGEGKDTPYFDNLQVNGNPVSPCGISWDGYGCLWISDLNLGAYLQVDPKTRQVVSFLTPPDNPDPAKYGQFRPASVKKLFTGMTTDGKRVWVMDEIEGNPLVYQLDVKFPTTGACAHPVDAGSACTVGAQPFCGADALCWGEAGAASTCHLKCDRASSANACPAGSACWTKPGVGDLCVAGSAGGFGAACSDAAQCQSALCVTDAAASATGYCSERCDPANAQACPDSYTCAGSGARARCEPAPKADTPPSSGSGGCAVGTGAGGLSLGALTFALLVFVRRRRRRA